MAETQWTEHSHLNEMISNFKERFSSHFQKENPLKGVDVTHYKMRKASVLIPLFYKNGELHVLLTKRSDDLTTHAGFVAFPGGMADEEDKNEIDTVLRESDEEIGLKPSDVTVLGVFAPGYVRPNSVVTPVLGFISSEFIPVMNEKEVTLVFNLPLKRFLTSERVKVTEFVSSDRTFYMHHFFNSIGGEEVDTWGFTANCCIITAIIAFQSDKQFMFADDTVVKLDNASTGLYRACKPVFEAIINKSLL